VHFGRGRLAAAPEKGGFMTTSAWVFMLTMWTVIGSMTAFCFYKLLTSARALGGDEMPDA
jgi:hypothetical protein